MVKWYHGGKVRKIEKRLDSLLFINKLESLERKKLRLLEIIIVENSILIIEDIFMPIYIGKKNII